MSPSPASPLSRREIQVARLVIEGATNREIAARLCVSDRTIQSHVANAMTKIGARTRTHPAVLVLRAGIVPLHPHGVRCPHPLPVR